MEEMIFRREGSIEIITLNRPEKLNAFSFSMIETLTRAFERLGLEDEVRAVVVTGEGRGFCTGADLTGSGARSDTNTPAGMRFSAQIYARLIRSMVDMEKPLIGAINGDAAGVGCTSPWLATCW